MSDREKIDELVRAVQLVHTDPGDLLLLHLDNDPTQQAVDVMTAALRSWADSQGVEVAFTVGVRDVSVVRGGDHG